ncbi:hypothetical protein [Vreelandella titanicae]|uniref:Uncharacterized protein n=1 Tax=Vreelandella titanicae TaxID=664683 RepID=A0A558JBN6_9GAMM|nr:hypothetical protein [Halomonas titanicae]TVU91031.1 hypothetical protein FQP89_08095 [Halomonas titanicae]
MGVIEVEQDGQKYSAEFVLEENVITVLGDSGQESTQLGGMSEEATAHTLLRTLIRKGNIEPIATE